MSWTWRSEDEQVQELKQTGPSCCRTLTSTYWISSSCLTDPRESHEPSWTYLNTIKPLMASLCVIWQKNSLQLHIAVKGLLTFCFHRNKYEASHENDFHPVNTKRGFEWIRLSDFLRASLHHQFSFVHSKQFSSLILLCIKWSAAA